MAMQRDPFCEPELLDGDGARDSIGLLMRAARPRDELTPALPGQLLSNGRIRLGPKIGSGGMGTVYAAWDDGKPIALKTIKHSAPLDIYRLKNEFRRLSSLVHPHLVMVHELFVEDGLWFFTMELVNGRPLNRYFNELPERNPRVLRWLMKQLVEGIAAIHEAGLLHRDVKPSNILVEPNGRVVILDFGLAGDRDPGGEGHTIPGQLCGTPAYMAPEHLLGHPSTEANDWYATGVVLYELLANACPFSGPLNEILRLKRGGELKAPQNSPHADTELIGLCEALLRPDPSERPTSHQLLAQVRTWSVGEGRVAAIQPVSERHDKFVGRSRQLHQLEDAYRRALLGRATIVWLSGPSGIGKSRLLRCFGDYLSGIDSPVILRGQCLESENVPHNAFDSVVDHFSRLASQLPEVEVAQIVPKYAGYLAKLFPVLLRIRQMESSIRAQTCNTETTDVLVQRRRAMVSLKDLFQRLAERRRLVLFLDDMQWADQDSMTLLKELTSPPDTPPMLIVAASRSELSPEVFGEDVTISLPLTPMSPEETLELASSLIPDTVPNRDDCLRDVVQQSDGLPIYATELARAFAESSDGSEPRSLAWLFQRRIAGLETESKQLLFLLAAAGRPLRASVVEELLGQPATRAIRVLRHQLLVSGEAIDGKEQLRLAHDQVRQAALASLDDKTRVETHSRLADVLLKQPEPEWLVSQLRSAERHEEAARHAAAAGRCAVHRFAFESAVEFFSLALTARDLSSDAEYELRIEYATALACDGQCDLSARQYLRAASMREPGAVATTLRAKAATQWLRAGFLDQGVAELRRVLGDVGISWPESTLAALGGFVWQRIHIRFSGTSVQGHHETRMDERIVTKLEALTPASTVLGAFDYVRGAYFSALTLPLALRSGSPRHLLNALASEAVYKVMLNGLRGLAAAEELVGQVESLTMPPEDEAYRRAIVGLVHAMTAYWSGNWGTVDGPSKCAEALFEESVPGSTWEVVLLRSIRHTARLQAAPPEVAVELPTLLSEATRHNDRYAIADLLRTQVMASLAARHTARAEDAFARLERELKLTPLVSLRHLVMATRVQLLLEIGTVPEAARVLEAEWQACSRLGMNQFPLVRSAVIGMRADILEADAQLSAESRVKQLRQLAKQAKAQPVTFARALTESLYATAERAAGNMERARDHGNAASAHYLGSGMELPALAELLELPEAACAASADLERRGAVDPSTWKTRRRCLF